MSLKERILFTMVTHGDLRERHWHWDSPLSCDWRLTLWSVPDALSKLSN